MDKKKKLNFGTQVEYSKTDLELLERMPYLKGKRHKLHQMIQESSQDSETGTCYGVFV